MVEKDQLVVLEEQANSQDLEQRMRGGVSGKEEIKRQDDQLEKGGYLVTGLIQDVDALLNEVNLQASNPQNFSCTVETDTDVSDQFIAAVFQYMQGKYTSPGDLVDLKKVVKGRLRIVGFKNETIKVEVQKKLWEIKHLKFPPEWEDIEKLIFDETRIIEKPLA